MGSVRPVLLLLLLLLAVALEARRNGTRGRGRGRGRGRRVCRLPVDKGPCMASITSFFFNSTSRACEPFEYGGCEGNGNRFDNATACENRCLRGRNRNRNGGRGRGPRSFNRRHCLLEKQEGNCRANITSFFYNSTSEACEEFIYGGCGGNKNRFSTLERCQELCAEDFCLQPPETGECRASIERFFYNSTTGTCETFTYGGCGGNGNRFPNVPQCQRKCSSHVCQLEPEPGMCLAYMPSYFYNATSGTCETFIYGGCGGNANRFQDEAQCLSTCQTPM